jgi:hypothetical protein
MWYISTAYAILPFALSLPDKENINTINLLKSNKMLIKQQQLFLRLINSGDISGFFNSLMFSRRAKGYKLAVVKSYMLHLILFVFEEMLSLDIDFKTLQMLRTSKPRCWTAPI